MSLYMGAVLKLCSETDLFFAFSLDFFFLSSFTKFFLLLLESIKHKTETLAPATVQDKQVFS